MVCRPQGTDPRTLLPQWMERIVGVVGTKAVRGFESDAGPDQDPNRSQGLQLCCCRYRRYPDGLDLGHE